MAVTGFDGITFWIKAENTVKNDITIQLREKVSDYSSIYWEKIYTWSELNAADGTKIEIPFDEFSPKASSYDGITQPKDGQVCGDNAVSEFSIYVGGSDKNNSFVIDDIMLYSKGGSDVTSVAVENVKLSKNTLSVEEGKTAALSATVLPSTATFKSVKWESADPSIATVVNGTVTGVKEGKTTITCISTTDSTKKDTCEVVVTKAVSEDEKTEDEKTEDEKTEDEKTDGEITEEGKFFAKVEFEDIKSYEQNGSNKVASDAFGDYSGAGYVYLQSGWGEVQFNVPRTGNYKITIVSNADSYKENWLYLDNDSAGTLMTPGNTWSEHTVECELTEGNHKFGVSTHWGYVALDYVIIDNGGKL